MERRGDTLSRYRLVDVLDVGRDRRAWKALDTRDDSDVILEILSDADVEDAARLARFRADLAAVARVDHPGIVKPREVDSASGLSFVVTEFAGGESLAGMIPRRGMTLARFLAVAVPLAEAFQAAHDAGLVHGNFHVQRVRVDDAGSVRILHFGFAALRERGFARGNPDDVMTITMTDEDPQRDAMPYLSPEHLQAKSVDSRSDLFSVGAVLYHMATGRHPFEGESAADVIVAILRDQPVPPTDLNPALPGELDRLLERVMSKDREARPSTAAELRHELKLLRPEA